MKIKHQSLAECVYEKMLKDIINGKLNAGTKLSEETICDQYGVSRTPAREAMLMLERDGLVERIPRRGFYVKAFDEAEIGELYQCRQILECLALEHGFDYIQEKELDKLKQVIDEALGNSQAELSMYADEKLHELIVESCPNKHLREIVKQLVQRTRPFRLRRSYGSSNINAITMERKNIIIAIRQKDKALAVKLLGEHIFEGAALDKG